MPKIVSIFVTVIQKKTVVSFFRTQCRADVSESQNGIVSGGGVRTVKQRKRESVRLPKLHYFDLLYNKLYNKSTTA